MFGSARPARRFNALRVLDDGPSRPAFAERAPSVRFRVPSEVLQGTPAPLGRSCDRSRATLSSLGFPAVRHIPGRRLRMMGGVPPLPRATSGVSTPIAAYHHRPSRRLAAPERPSAYLLEAFSSRRSGVLADASALLSFLTSVRSLLREAVGRGRLQGVDLGANSFGPSDRLRTNPRAADASLPPRGCPPSSVLPRRPGVALWSRALPVHDRIVRRLDRFVSSGLADRRGRFAPLGATGSSGVFHLATVADSFRPARGASSWFRFMNRARCMRRGP